ncbi:lipid A biosynthesis acyltransferase [Desulfarculus baarsii DSM 2075]|uniref:Lipid A biosynthesis acyltransferase n=2 Tax=Desulfarculus baarsii TaxID=453230 RepID=E1QIE1_DESB2|nr:lipid A biosynthesis acyltransferase [Desulfarculus baarsii DSM 2075]
MGGGAMKAAYKILFGVAWLLSWLPLWLMRWFGRLTGRLVFTLDRRHRQIMLDNLALSFPGKSPAELRKLALSCLRHICSAFFEMPRLVRYSPAQAAAMVRVHGKERLDRAQARGRGVILLTGHIGNWEWMNAASIAIINSPALVVARPIDWPPADRLVNYWRCKDGSRIVAKDSSARSLLRELRAGGYIALLLDQNVDWYDGEWVDFFGRPACSNKGAALLAMKTKAAVVPVWCARGPDGKFDIFVGEELPLVDTGHKTQDVWDNTQNYQRALEDIIRQRPEQWFWLHQRWKTKPYHPWPREKR